LAGVRHFRPRPMPTPPNSRVLAYSSALAARSKKVDINDRALLNFICFTTRTLRMFIKNIFFTSQPQNLRHKLQWKRCALAHRANAGVYRQLSNAYLNSSNANALHTVMNVIVARPAALVKGGLDPNKISGVGTNFGLIIHVLPGPNKRHVCKKSLILSWISKQKK
jgi:hypothetical protein